MSAPKSRVKQQKIARKRQRKEAARLKRERKRQNRWSDSDFGGPILHFGAPGLPAPFKMSDVLSRFVEPYADGIASSIEEYRALLTMGKLAWNATLIDEPKRGQIVDKCIAVSMEECSLEDRSLFRKQFYEMIARKERLFAHYRREIIGFEVHDTGDGWHLNVASLLV